MFREVESLPWQLKKSGKETNVLHEGFPNIKGTILGRRVPKIRTIENGV